MKKLKIRWVSRILTAIIAVCIGIIGISAGCYAFNQVNEYTEHDMLYGASSMPSKSKNLHITYGGQKISGTAVNVKVKKSYQFKTVLPQGARNSKITWSTSNSGIASVSKTGKVIVKKTGTAKITAKLKNGKKAVVTLKAIRNPVKIQKLKISGKRSMKVKRSQTLSLTITPATADNRSVTWKSSNPKIATVDSKGKVTARKNGTVKITVKVKDSSRKTGSFSIRVTK